MKKVKKLASALMALVMVFSLLAVSASAAAPEMIVERLAYMDLDSAPAAMREDILKARAQIIYGEQPWTVDGAVFIIHGDGTVETLPEFSDLYPGWDVPSCDTIKIDFMPMGLADADIEFGDNVYLELYPDSGVNTKDFFSFAGNGRPVGVYAQTWPMVGACYNIGFTNQSIGKDLGWVPNLSGKAAAAVQAKAGQLYGVRGSVYRQEYVGQYWVKVTQDFSDREPVIFPDD